MLVTRAADQAEETARRLRERGHVPVIAPLRRVERLLDRLEGPPPMRLVATSANAVRDVAIPAAWRDVPFLAVGEGTARAAREAGFARVSVAEGDARSAARHLLAQGVHPEPVLFLAGQPRKPDFEARLTEARQAFRIVETYRMVADASLPAEVIAGLREGRIEAVLHFSAESASAFLQALGMAGLVPAAVPVRHVALSGDVAAPLLAAGLSPAALRVAPQPSQQVLLELLGPAGV
ncbi:MAG: uroporphyrinogen-III synthase [Beijerinckiaceae bacterium]|nr:uroporphyrinogen-III synthase [Beijerinckiaceae bacterium]